MLNKQGFNLWADDYDKTVQNSEENDSYPFAGYKTILNIIFNEVMQKQNSKVLDIGFGTGILKNSMTMLSQRDLLRRLICIIEVILSPKLLIWLMKY